MILKQSSVGTVGYRIAGVRIVGLDGRPPSWLSMAVRLLFLLLGPFMLVIDLVWISADKHRQSLRDKFGNTYVVKRTAEPVGAGNIVHCAYDILGFSFSFREVEAAPPALTGSRLRPLDFPNRLD
jgi:hypothetical protein